ncbi:hypothetical protein CTZ28_25460 [Streptomyces shenzhenensis]|uniref:Uncharacterized protein n=1 Tax=Streptomyces shenzhenensis TaxID=943815 RepID=A0A3M0I8C5_9ACTN|nr:hypothetical protein CTZ28_25460 [Streptomyces shenzhenensis]
MTAQVIADDAESVAFRRAGILAEVFRLGHCVYLQVTRRQGTAPTGLEARAVDVAVAEAGALFEVSGTRSALDSRNPHRHRRDARTPTPHDPARRQVQHIGRQVRGGSRPPRHGLL